MSNTIQFRRDNGTPATEVLRLSQDGIWANPDIPVDDAAKLVLAAIDDNIRIVVQVAVAAEREACAKVCETFSKHVGYADAKEAANTCATAIRARGQE